jgi:DNA-binding response OmpR family regulator
MRGFLERQLRSDGFDVLAFPSTDELPRAADPDMLVLGDPDELDRCRVPDCPVIVLGRPDPEAKVRALERCDDYLARPFVYEELVALISHNGDPRFRSRAGLFDRIS